MNPITSKAMEVIRAVRKRPEHITITYWAHENDTLLRGTIEFLRKSGYKTRNYKQRGKVIATRADLWKGL